MQKTTKILPVIIVVFFLFNCFSISNELIAQARKQSKSNTKSRKLDKSKLASSNELTAQTDQQSDTKSKKSYQPQELKVASLLPEEYTLKGYSIKFISLTLEIQDNMMAEINEWLNTRYKWGGKSENGIDCSGFTSMIFERVLGLQIPRSSVEQMKFGTPIESISDLQFGDLVFFKSGRRNPGHVGIYIGEGLFAHSSSYQKRGVVTSTLTDGNYLKRYVGARRILGEQITMIGG
jgi:cell wall-associated NlpC family hydrolase